MITNFKIYESKFVRTPVRNDWVIDTSGQIVKIVLVIFTSEWDVKHGDGMYRMKSYDDDHYPTYISRKFIKHFGTKDEMESIKTAKKYNI